MIAARTTPAVTRQLNRWTYRPLRTEWTTIPAGEFLMGSLEGYREDANTFYQWNNSG